MPTENAGNRIFLMTSPATLDFASQHVNLASMNDGSTMEKWALLEHLKGSLHFFAEIYGILHFFSRILGMIEWLVKNLANRQKSQTVLTLSDTVKVVICAATQLMSCEECYPPNFVTPSPIANFNRHSSLYFDRFLR